MFIEIMVLLTFSSMPSLVFKYAELQFYFVCSFGKLLHVLGGVAGKERND